MSIHRSVGNALALASLGLLVPASGLLGQATLTITSPAFQEGQPIPLRYSAYGDNVSPALAWTGAPQATRSFAIIVTDPDAPTPQPFVHWVIYNIPGSATGLPEGLPTEARVGAPAAIAGTTNGVPGMPNRTGYFGPRPPAGGPHRYIFTVYALDIAPDLAEGMNQAALLAAMQGHILAQGQLIGTYQQTN